jgi:hypothetical protein
MKREEQALLDHPIDDRWRGLVVRDSREARQNRGLEIIELSCCRNLVRNRPVFGAGLASARRFNGPVRR